MTRPQDSQETRPISVAELLARNGTIGAPPVGGRRRRRRGNADAVTVAELTGEIPVVTDADVHAAVAGAGNGTGETVVEPEVAPAPEPEVAEPETGPEVAEPEPEAAEVAEAPAVVPAEEMAPDAFDVDDADDEDTAIALEELGEQHGESDGQLEVEDLDEADSVPSYLSASPEPLYGGRTAHDELRYDGPPESVTAVDVPPKTTTVEDLEEAAPPSRLQKLARGALIVLQSILAVAFGAGLFIAFDLLWSWNNIIALVLSVLVILGLVAAVWVVRKTEDIASTLIAVAVGALVTMGPLVLHSN